MNNELKEVLELIDTGRTDWRERLDAAIDQARGKAGQEVGNG